MDDIILAARTVVWMRQLTADLNGEPATEPTVVFEDNQAAIAMAKNPQFHGRSKHISIKYHFVRDKVNDGTINISYCPTTEMIADMLTICSCVACHLRVANRFSPTCHPWVARDEAQQTILYGLLAVKCVNVG